MPRKAKADEEVNAAEKKVAETAGLGEPAGRSIPNYRIGDKLRLTVREPIDREDSRADAPGNYIPQEFVGEVEGVNLEAEVPSITVRWHLPAAYGHDTQKGAASTLIHIANGVWLETRKRARNVTATIEQVSEDEYGKLVEEAATP